VEQSEAGPEEGVVAGQGVIELGGAGMVAPAVHLPAEPEALEVAVGDTEQLSLKPELGVEPEGGQSAVTHRREHDVAHLRLRRRPRSPRGVEQGPPAQGGPSSGARLELGHQRSQVALPRAEGAGDQCPYRPEGG